MIHVLPARVPYLLACGILIGTAFALALPAHAGTVTEKRLVVWDKDFDREIPPASINILNAIRVKVKVGSTGYAYHFMGTLVMEYDASKVHPASDVPLKLTWIPYDGDGYEYEDQHGLKFEVDLTFLEWEFQIGYDHEMNFVPPLRGQSRLDSELGSLLAGKGLDCLAGIELAMNNDVTLKGDEILFEIEIKEPADERLVHFKDSGSLYTSVKFTTNTVVTRVLRITPLCLDPEIVLGGNGNWYHLIHTSQSRIGPHAWINCWTPGNWCNTCDKQKMIDLFDAREKPQYASYDKDESEPMEWRLQNGVSIGGIQDLVAEVMHPPGAQPVVGEPDTLIARIHNLHQSICREYASFDLVHEINDGQDQFVIGTTHVDASDSQLVAFNSGTLDTMTFSFVYDSLGTNYILRKNHQWGVGSPRYVTTLNAVTLPPGTPDPCSDWRINAEASVSANNISYTPFRRPTPDFSIDDVHVSPHSYLRFGDVIDLDCSVSNSGANWPPDLNLSVDPRDSVYVLLRVAYETRNEHDEWLEAYGEVIAAYLVTPIARGDSQQIGHSYTVPDETFLGQYGPIDRVTFIFQVNDGSTPVNWVVWESDFQDNEASASLLFTEYVDRGYPSSNYYSDGQYIASDLPDVRQDGPLPSTPVYLYLDDPTFVLDGSPPPVQVELGIGGYQTSPSEDAWVWYPATFAGDFTDGDGVGWKVFGGDLSMLGAFIGKRSYCFRASMDFLDYYPSHLYVDKDGACVVRGEENPYFYNKAGTVGSGGDGGFLVGFGATSMDVLPGATIALPVEPANLAHLSGSCVSSDWFSLLVDDTHGWTITTASPDSCRLLLPGESFLDSVVVEVPDTVGVGISDTVIVRIAYCTADSIVNPWMEDCEDPNWDGGTAYFSADTLILNVLQGPTAVAERRMPDTFELHQNYPNPFNPTTTIAFDVAEAARVELAVFDVRGRRIATLVNGRVTPGRKTVQWNGENRHGAQVASGVYFYRLRTRGYVQTRKLVLLK